MNVSGIATQGFMGINAYYVEQYKVAYSDDGVTWEPFKEVNSKVIQLRGIFLYYDPEQLQRDCRKQDSGGRQFWSIL